jgi:hypothetical protein
MDHDIATTEPAGQAGTEADRVRCRQVLQRACTLLGGDPAQGADLLDTEALLVDGVPFVLRLNPAGEQLEFFADGGRPRECDEVEVCRHLLEEALSNDIPALSFGLHPVSRHVVAKGAMCVATLDDDGQLCAALMLMAAERVHALHARFSLATVGS